MTAIGFQLYSSRNFPPLTDTLRMLAEIGYAEVEGYSALFQDNALFQQLLAGLDASGLRMPTAHFGLDVLRGRPGEVIDLCRRIGISTVFVPYLAAEDRPKEAQGWAAFGTELAELGKPLQDAGLGYGWHNHDFELVDLGIPEAPLDLILQASDDLLIELDVAWVVRGGRDPLQYISNYGDRIRAVHVKDIAADGACMDEDGWADVGQGVMDWPGYYAALRDGAAQHYIMEHDNPSDHLRFAARSLDAALELGKAQ